MSILLTELQSQALALEPGQPVEMVDPATERRYVLLPAEQFQQMRDLLVPQPSTTSQRVYQGRLPVRLRDLDVSAEVKAEIDAYCRKCGMASARNRRSVEEDLKLQFHFGGQCVGVLQSNEGSTVVAAGRVESEQFGRQLESVDPKQRRNVVLMFPTPWHDSISMILTPSFADEADNLPVRADGG